MRPRMEALAPLLLVFAGLLIINAVSSALLWAQYKSPLYRSLTGLWVAGIFGTVVQGLVQTDPWMVFAFGVSGPLMTLFLADLLAGALGLRMPWRAYAWVVVAGLLLTTLATALGAPFWVRALPVSVGTAVPVLDTARRAVLRPRRLTPTAKLAVFGALALGLHNLDYPMFRDDPRFATAGFVVGFLTVFTISIAAPAIVLEHTTEEVKRLNRILDARISEALQAIQDRDEFLSIAAHELRGPLNALHLAIQSLQRKAAPDAPQARTYALVERAGQRLTRFVNQLLDLGRIRAGALAMERSDVDLKDLVREVSEQIASDLTSSGSTLEVEVGDGIVGQWDRFRLGQVLANLLSNAIKFGNGKPIRIVATVADGWATFHVSDQGTGIDPGVRERIFLPYERGVSARHYGGLGLGLHIANSIVIAQGGRLTVASVPEQGATFTVTLPIHPAGEA